ncbi:UNVERIFIED_CONTAM: hypothetical protein Sradi_0221300 [Sesamum radiatum]|uniref:Uncharacterized protein n=1 Tax=Sesamum radiatum TaxID=300843 RepID=A0AAW2W1K8_SESRA
MLLPFLCLILCFRGAISQTSRELSARELDSLLQDYAFRAFVRPRTGVVYDGQVPANLTGIGVAALRLRSGSLRRRGVPSYKEFHIPAGVVEQPYVERLVLVYHNLELDVRAAGDPISITFRELQRPPGRISPMCAYFGLDGSVGFDNVVKGNTCLTTNQGHFAIVVESLVAPAPAPSGGGGGGGGGAGGGTTNTGGGKGSNKRVWIIPSSVIGGAALLVLLAVVFAYVKKCRHRKKIRRMENASELGVPLPMTTVGQTKAPVALETRTRPLLENEFVP